MENRAAVTGAYIIFLKAVQRLAELKQTLQLVVEVLIPGKV